MDSGKIWSCEDKKTGKQHAPWKRPKKLRTHWCKRTGPMVQKARQTRHTYISVGGWQPTPPGLDQTCTAMASTAAWQRGHLCPCRPAMGVLPAPCCHWGTGRVGYTPAMSQLGSKAGASLEGELGKICPCHAAPQPGGKEKRWRLPCPSAGPSQTRAVPFLPENIAKPWSKGE